MKKLLAILLAVMLLPLSAACASSMLREQKEAIDRLKRGSEDEIIADAIDSLKAYWQEEMYGNPSGGTDTGYLEIKWTRVVYIKDEITASGAEMFADMDCYVEFFLLSDYFGSAPYYSHAGTAECVAVKKDGSFEVLRTDPLSTYRAKTYQIDFTPIIEDVSDRGAEFNQTFILK